jgi:glutathione synthase
MKKYNFLVLTDHRKHSDQNSLYTLIAKLSVHAQCNEVFVASRGNTENDCFFKDMTTNCVHATLATSDFVFQQSEIPFIQNTKEVSLDAVDVIVMRLPRPVSDDFLHYLIDIAGNKIFINNPLGIIKTSPKEFLLNFAKFCPPMKLCRSAIDVFQYANKFPIVLKPLKGYGGKGIVKIEGHKVYTGKQVLNLKDYLAHIKQELETEGLLAMKFLKNVSKGDKRILVVNGEIIAGSLRLPPKNSWICNVAQGGKAVLTTISLKEKLMIKEIAPILLKHGIVIFGADTLVDDNNERVLSEINTLSIGGFPQSEEQTGKPVLQMTINNIIEYINTQ